MENYNPTCIYTGKKENLIMKAHRNANGDMVGWIFINEEFANANAFDLKIDFVAKPETLDVPKQVANTSDKPIVQYQRSRIDNNPHG